MWWMENTLGTSQEFFWWCSEVVGDIWLRVADVDKGAQPGCGGSIQFLWALVCVIMPIFWGDCYIFRHVWYSL